MGMSAMVDHAQARPTASFVRVLAVFGGAAVLLLLLSLFAASSAFAATITVDTTDDTPGNCSIAGQCTLRAAVNQSNGSGGSNTIQIPAGTYVLDSGELAIHSNVEIIGAGGDPNGNPAGTVIKQTGVTGKRVFNLNPDSDTGYNISLKTLTVSGGQLWAGELYGGGGILGYTGSQGTVTIENCVVTGNSVSAPGHWGGGMNIAGLPGGKVVLRNTVVQGNTAMERGGGVHFEGDMNIDVLSSVIDGNIASNGLGGGMTVFPASAGGQIRIDGTTISRNQANGTIDPQAGGGGLYLSVPATITNTTISGNTAKGQGGGLYVASKGNITLTHVTLFGNKADQGGGGLYVQDGNPMLQNTLAAGNSKAGNAASDLEARTGQNVVAGIDATSSYNLVGLGGNGLVPGGSGNLVDVADPGVLPLGANGGLGETNALKGSSPAIGKGSNALAATFDQRGFPRKKNVAVDIGAYEGLPDAAIGANNTYAVTLPWDETKLSGLTATSSDQTVVPNGNVVITGSGATRTLTVSPTAGGTADIQVTANSSVSGMSRSLSTSFKMTVTGPPDLSIAKTHTGDFTQGQTGATYTMTVKNLGDSATSGTVTVKDTLPAGLTATGLVGTGWTCTLGTLTCTRTDVLQTGASYPDITLKVTVAANAPASVTNTVKVSGGGDASTSNNTASDPTNIIQLPDLTIEKSHAGNFKQGQTGAVYTIIVRNAGTGTTSGAVAVADTLPAGMTATGFAGTGWTCDPGTLTCSRSDALASGGNYPPITMTVNVAANAAAQLTNTATVSGGGDVNNANNTASDPTTIIPVADLTLVKSHTGSFTQGQASAAYTLTVTNSGQGATDDVVTVTDTLPAGMTLKGVVGNGWSCDTGTLSCTRSDALAGGAAYPPITVTVSVNQDAPATVTNTAVVSGGGELQTGNNSAGDVTAIHPKPQIATSSLPQGTVGVAYSQTLTATGGDGTYVWAVADGALPAGVTFDPAAAKLSGTPTTESSYSFTVQATDGNGVTATKELTIQVNPMLEVSTTGIPHGAVGAAYTASLEANGGNGVYTWSMAAGTLPSGLTLAADGTLSGTPTGEGAFSFTVLVKDGNAMTASRAMTLQIHPQLVIQAPALPEGTVGVAYPQLSFSATGGNGTYTWSVVSGSLPAGMTFDPAAAAISGTPMADGTYSFTVQVADGNGVKASKAVTLLVRAALTVQTPELPAGTVGVAYANQEFSAAGGSGTYTWSVSGTLPAGLTFAVDSLDPKKAFVQGKPTAAGNYEFEIQVKDSNGVTVVKNLSIQVNPELIFTAVPLPEGTVGLTYAGRSLSAAGGSGTYRWSVEDGRLPDGLTLNASRGTIDGTPKESGVYTVTIQVKDGNGIAVSKVLTLKIHPPVLLGIAFEASEYAVLTGETRETVVKATYSDSKVVRLTAGVVYTIKDTSVAVVNSSGQLTGIKSGSTVLAATYGGIKAETSVLVNKSITGLAFDRPSYSLKVGEQANTVVSATYGGGRIVLTNGVIYSVKDAAIAEVDLHGVVIGKKAGTTVVSATYGEDTVQATIVVNLDVTLTGIRFTPDTYELKTGQSVPTVLIADFSDKSTTPIGRGAVHTFQTEGIARISEEGLVTALQPGTTVVTATYGGRSATAVIRVSAWSDGGSGGDSDSGSSPSPSTGTGPAPTPTPGGITVNLELGNGSKETINVSQDDIRSGVIRVTASDSSAYVELPSATIAKLLAMNPELSILFQTAGGLMELPLAQIDPQTLAKLLGLPAGDIQVNVGIRMPDAQEREQLGEAIRRIGGKELAAPADFYVRITDGKGNEVKQNVFTSYTVRTLPLNGQAKAATATGVWWDPVAHEYRFVPTVFETRDGKPVAKLKRQGFSVYTVLDRFVSFGDLQGHWAKATIESLASKLIVQGRKADAYEPEGHVTRAEWAALLVRSLGLNVSQEKAPFGDVKDGDWFAAAVGAAHRAKLIDGYEDGTFRPNQTVTREELAAMTARAIKYVGVKPADIRSDSESFHDSANISGWAGDAVHQAVKAGIIEGDDQGRFRPADSASRAEAATMLYRLLKAISFI